uniref:Uncharacterized protein n=1 Tax=Populus trichocarpa TaxID=3694 RepID=U5FEL9_POPTR
MVIILITCKELLEEHYILLLCMKNHCNENIISHYCYICYFMDRLGLLGFLPLTKSPRINLRNNFKFK